MIVAVQQSAGAIDRVLVVEEDVNAMIGVGFVIAVANVLIVAGSSGAFGDCFMLYLDISFGAAGLSAVSRMKDMNSVQKCDLKLISYRRRTPLCTHKMLRDQTPLNFKLFDRTLPPSTRSIPR